VTVLFFTPPFHLKNAEKLLNYSIYWYIMEAKTTAGMQKRFKKALNIRQAAP